MFPVYHQLKERKWSAINVFIWQAVDLSMGDLLLHTSVTWINPSASLGKWKKEPQLAAFGMSWVSCLSLSDLNKLDVVTNILLLL